MFESLSILYLEDEPLIALDTGEFLQSLGFRTVEVAYRLQHATRLMEQMDFDLALLDINVDRGQTSLQLGDALAARGTTVIFASGNSGSAEHIQKRGQRFLGKPFLLPELSDKLENAVRVST